MRAALSLLPLLLCAGCALEAGEGFAVLQPAVQATYAAPAARDAGEGFQRLSSDFQVRLTVARMQLEPIALLGREAGGGATAFDPANPPPGYTICHNGHCDREDGALVPYEEVAAELAGGGATASTVASLPVGELDLLAGERRELPCTPDCELPRTHLSSGRWTVTALRLEGTVRDGRATPRFPGERPFQLKLPTTGTGAEPLMVLTGTLDVPSDRAHAPRVLLELTLELTPARFDSVDWATAQSTDGLLDLGSSSNTEARTRLLGELSELAPQAEVKREQR